MDEKKPSGPDFMQGVRFSSISDGQSLLGHVGDAAVLLVRAGAEVFAIGAECTHYHGPLAEGVVDGGAVRCPWHHACFDIRTGEALHAPALSPLACWKVERQGDTVLVKETIAPKPKPRGTPSNVPDKIVIVGGGAAGFAAAEMLRRQDFRGSIVMLSNDDAPPVDRPNLSKDYLAGSAPEDWLPLRPDDFYRDNHIDLRLKADVAAINPRDNSLTLADGGTVPYDRLLLATGAEPVRLPIPGANLPHVHVLRTLNDCRAIIRAASSAKRAVVIGASFIGLEVAASLRARKVAVHVVAPEKQPLERVFGAQMGDFVRKLHEENGVVFHLEDTSEAITANQVKLKSGVMLDADFVVTGVGVRPRIALAEKAGLAVDRGVMVDTQLRTSAPNIFAAGDIARWPDPHSGEHIRVEHWVVAERQGQTAALNMMGMNQPYSAVPFFWSQHYDVPISYVGHAEKWDDIAIAGDIGAKDCILRYRRNGRVLAVASIYRDRESLEAEIAMERETV
jgi:NADPH-dependent 2,4-dienoyl-CoA reductase/sulfur reductase-like enzyme/nitrite reductase/ring-hydroxylating ferredoxin subunit